MKQEEATGRLLCYAWLVALDLREGRPIRPDLLDSLEQAIAAYEEAGREEMREISRRIDAVAARMDNAETPLGIALDGGGEIDG